MKIEKNNKSLMLIYIMWYWFEFRPVMLILFHEAAYCVIDSILAIHIFSSENGD